MFLEVYFRRWVCLFFVFYDVGFMNVVKLYGERIGWYSVFGLLRCLIGCVLRILGSSYLYKFVVFLNSVYGSYKDRGESFFLGKFGVGLFYY